jgi:AbrB family looped-hinge helix DNA binding protein
MRVTIDMAGRLVIPKPLRDAVGIVPGEVEVTRDGAGIRIEPAVGEGVRTESGRLVIDDDAAFDRDRIRELRLGDQR